MASWRSESTAYMATARLAWQPTSMKKSASTAQMRDQTRLREPGGRGRAGEGGWVEGVRPGAAAADLQAASVRLLAGLRHPVQQPPVHAPAAPAPAARRQRCRPQAAPAACRQQCRPQAAPAPPAHRMRPMLKCAISTILARLKTRGQATGRSSSAAIADSVLTNCTMASLSSRPLLTNRRLSSCTSTLAMTSAGGRCFLSTSRVPGVGAGCRGRGQGWGTVVRPGGTCSGLRPRQPGPPACLRRCALKQPTSRPARQPTHPRAGPCR